MLRPAPSPPCAPQLLEAMERYWGYDSFLPLQAEAMAATMDQRDSLVVLPTGGGKSLCFQAPAVCREGVALVVSPLISLMKDQVDALAACGVPAAAINSTLSAGEKRRIAEQMRRGEIKLAYLAPERLLSPRTIEFFQSLPLSLIAIDEAHCISQWGHDFRPEYRGLRILKEAFPQVGVHAYTATASAEVRRDIVEQLGLFEPRVLVGSFDRPNLVFRVRRADNRFGQVVELVNQHQGEAGIVYCISRKEVDKTAAALANLGIKALPYHAGLSDEERHGNQEAFLQEECDVVVATVAFGMGIDKSNVRYVIHAGMPKSLEHYVQESGRAGRDGLEADCLLLYSGRDAQVWKMLIEKGDAAGAAGAVAALDAMTSFCTAAGCRHRALVAHFGQELDRENCGACDVCLGELDLVDDPLTLSQKILSCVARLGERYGGDYTAKVLAGSREERILAAGHEALSTYGILGEQSIAAIRHWIDQLVGQGYLAKSGEFNVLALTDDGRRVFRGERTPTLTTPAEPRERSRRAASSAGADSWEGVDRELFERLRGLRSELAAARGVPPYLVFGDASLRDMARRRPSTLEGFVAVHGVGAQKRADFGEAFVAAIGAYCSETGVATDIALDDDGAADRKRRQLRADGPNLSSLAAFDHFRRGESLEEVMKRLGRARSTIAGYLTEYLRHEQVLDPTPWVEPALARRIEAAIEAVGGDRLRPLYDQLGGEVTYEDIRIVAACVANRDGG